MYGGAEVQITVAVGSLDACALGECGGELGGIEERMKE